MIKNRTLEFKSKYSSTDSKHSSKRDISPDYVKNKLTLTGFSTNSETSTMQKKSSKKMAKVESTAFLKSRAQLKDVKDQPTSLSKKGSQNQNSLCKYLKNKTMGIENHIPQHYKKTLIESEISDRTALLSQDTQKRQHQQPTKSLIRIKPLSDVDKFFSSLTPRSLFFCCRCFRYIFAIQKNLHYPQCENEVDVTEMDKREREMIAWEKMSMLVELSQYTKTKTDDIGRLVEMLKRNKLGDLYEVEISTNANYLSFDDIILAFFYTYEKLLKDNIYVPSTMFSVKKIFNCVQANGFQSTLFERKFFG